MNTVETAQRVEHDEYTTDLQILEDPLDDLPNLTQHIRQNSRDNTLIGENLPKKKLKRKRKLSATLH